MRFLQHSIELRGQDAVHEVRHTLEQIDEPDSCLVRLVLTGVLNPVASGRLQQTLAELEPRFFGFEIDSSHLLSLPDELSHEVLDSRLMKQVASRLAEYARSENLTPPSESSFGARLPEELAGGETLCNAGSRALELLFGQVRLGVRNRVGDNK